MATLMEKDVLLEYVASKIAKANINNQLEIMESLKDIREFLYKTNCKDIDYKDSIAKIKQISLESANLC
ncbi:hypothetical protein DCO58_01140 [Helicobacter saguini]|uniref:Uncharacterized protein n=1 Tax=Helicobacter saguini TaxID=1548018 RepID=A0A099BCP4_9HELI|nr:hypothetical protein [Helicobacter saguini]MWV63006.1 hypothetical protein [Helicobacter saguini]MWV66325.1 hypothetical protein [Helicobacter saguini]MWV68677.1 hypothetical protein [Helicobacter saguini]MWV71772.1 hypothetical protein [Helicobacter saguini]TLD95801.1 hypothetical protein LS64_000045 [Helicobacter saguini]